MLPFIKRFLFWVSLVATATIVIAFSISNREMLTINLAPLPYSLELPAYLFSLLFLFTGLLLSAVYFRVKLILSHWKSASIEQRIHALENELAVYRTRPKPAATTALTIPAETR